MAVILIIDDSPTELHLFQQMLTRNGFDTLVADSGEEGLRQDDAAVGRIVQGALEPLVRVGCIKVGDQPHQFSR